MASFNWSMLFAILGTAFTTGVVLMPLTLLIATSILRQRRSPASSVLWLATVLMLPFVGIPLYWLFGSRKIRRIAQEKPRVELSVPDPAAAAATQPATASAPGRMREEGITQGNALHFHASGEEAFADVMAAIDAARRSIHIQTYQLKADATGRAVLDRLTKRAGEGIEVRLLVDGLGSFHVARGPLRRLRKAGGQVAFFMPVWRITLANRSNLRNHRKIAVFDGTRVIAGGRNLAHEYLGPDADGKRWADLSFALQGPAAAHYDEVFRYDWAFATREQLAAPAADGAGIRAGEAVVQVVPSGPDVADDDLFKGILSFIFAAKHRIWIATPYFLPNEMLTEALAIAAERGVDVRIIIPERSDQWLADLARGQVLRELCKWGCKIHLYRPSMLHAKAVLVDGVTATVGSANFDARSMFLNFEVSSVVHSAPEVRAVETWLEGILLGTTPFAGRVGSTRDTLEGVARLIAPML